MAESPAAREIAFDSWSDYACAISTRRGTAMQKRYEIEQLMALSEVKFGTSGARGLADNMTDEVCYAYTIAFLQHLEHNAAVAPGSWLAIAGDLRPSTPRICAAVARAAVDSGVARLPYPDGYKP